ncbi:unnamed protein product [Parajaminaea phylloscopi]
MRPSLAIITVAATAALALSSSLVAASPVAIVERDAEAPAAAALDEAAVLESRRKHKKHRKGKKSGKGGMATWYTGNQMNAPACGGHKPSDSDYIAAVSANAPYKCHERVTLQKGGKTVTVKIVDFCESCSASPTHFDLSKAAFKKLASLDAGEVHGLNYWRA